MPRLMSVSLTEDAVVARTKTVTRRLGWTMLRTGDRITLCRKVMGRRRRDGSVEPLVRLAEVQVYDVRREPLDDLITGNTDYGHREVMAEGFPQMTPEEFIAFFTSHMGCKPDHLVTRIEWRYL